MDKKPKARGAPRKTRQPKLEDKEQSERFIKIAREIGVDESGKPFNEAIRSIFYQKQGGPRKNRPD